MATDLPSTGGRMSIMSSLWLDARHALRSLRLSPGFTAVALLLLALGIGANTAVFSVVYGVLLRPLPYPQPDRLVELVRVGGGYDNVNVPEALFMQQNGSAFASVAAYTGGADRTVRIGGALEWVGTTQVTTGFLRTLGVAPALGREFLPEEARAGAPGAVILSDALWRRAFGARREIVGSTITLSDAPYTVAGVLPRDFWFPRPIEMLTPIQFRGTGGELGTNTTLLARLAPGVSLQQARERMAALTPAMIETVQNLPEDYRGLTPVSYRGQLASSALRTNLLLLFGAVGLLLLIACANLAALLLARLTARQREIAVRLALGSSPGRLFRQFLVENFLLSAAGGLAGVLLAAWLLEGLLAIVPFGLPSPAPIALSLPVLAFAFTVVAGTNLLFSVAPLFSASRLDVFETLKAGARVTAGGARQFARSALVTGQVAVAVVLLVSAALLIQSLYRLHQEQLGFRPDGVITFRTPVAPERQGNEDAMRQFNDALLAGIQALPGVRRAGAVDKLPLLAQNNFPVQREGHPEQSIGGMEIRGVTPGYFETMGIPIVRGRDFQAADAAGAPAILVSESVARAWWGAGDPVGDHVIVGGFQGKRFGNDPPRVVIGVVADTKSVELRDRPRPTVYLSTIQAVAGSLYWVARADNPAALAGPLRQLVRRIDPRQKVENMRTMDEIVANTTRDSRFDAWLFGGLAGLALVLTAIGIYGLLAFAVARRTSEIGTRMALGATPGQVLRMVLGQGVVRVVIGLVVGLAVARGAAGFLETLLFGVSTTAWTSYALVAGVLLGAALLASYLPARRAMRVDPVVALRSE